MILLKSCWKSAIDNTVNDLRYEIKIENRVKDKNSFFLSKTLLFLFNQKYILYLGDIFLRFLEIQLLQQFFLARQILKNIDTPRQMSRMLHC